MHARTYTQREKAVYPKSLSNIKKQTRTKSAHQQLGAIWDYEELNILNLNTIYNDSSCVLSHVTIQILSDKPYCFTNFSITLKYFVKFTVLAP
jgi:hypothetical protein